MTTKKLTKLIALYLPYILLGLVATKDPKQIEFALKKIAGRVKAILGTGSNCTRKAVEKSRCEGLYWI